MLSFLLPSPCLACDRPIGDWRPLLGLCVTCRGRLRRPASRCFQCGTPLETPEVPARFRCGECRHAPPPFDRLLAVYVYRPPLDAVMRGLKFDGLAYLGRHAADLLCEAHGDALRTVDTIVPVPLHWRRRLERGFNQAEEIARPLARRLGRPRVHALLRRRATPPQARLARRDRLRNLRGAFRGRRLRHVADRHVLLVDDVATTAATVRSAAAALRAGGARAVTVGVLARTPADARSTPPKSGKILEVGSCSTEDIVSPIAPGPHPPTDAAEASRRGPGPVAGAPCDHHRTD